MCIVVMDGFLQVHAGAAALKAANLEPSAVDSVCVGNVLSCAGVDTPYVARHTLLRLNIGVDKPANTVNRLCGSGFQVRSYSGYLISIL